MHTSSLPLLIVAIAPIAGSLIVLALAAVGRGVWITHLLAISLGCCLAFVGSQFSYLSKRKIAAFAIITLTLFGLATTLLGGDSTDPSAGLLLDRLGCNRTALIALVYRSMFGLDWQR